MADSITNLLGELRVVGHQLRGVDCDVTFREPVSESSLVALATAFGPLPTDYVTFLRQCGGFIAMDIHNGYDIFGPELVTRLADTRAQPNFVRIETVASRALPVAGDGGGNLFLLHLSAPHRVWKWNHEVGTSDATVDDRARELSLVADGFTAFLARVVEDWRHFAVGASHWKYISG